MAPCMDNHVSSIVPRVDANLNLNADNNNGLKEANEKVGLLVTRPNKQIAKWTRLNRMEVRPNDLNHFTSTLMLGKRSMEDVLDMSCVARAVTLFATLS